MPTVKEISDYIDLLAPYSTKCEWDNCGVLIGKSGREVNKIAFVLDLTLETLENAAECGAQLVVTHHPVIFRAQKNFVSGNIAYEAAVKGIDVISAHTCFDSADGGVNDVLCELLEIQNVKGVESDECAVPMARIGETKTFSPRDFASFVAKKLGTTVRLINGGRLINRVAVCGGAGMSFMNDAVACGADAFVTGEIRHHEMLEAKEKGITVVAAGHFETESPAMAVLMKNVQQHFPQTECMLLHQSNPAEFIGEK